MKINWTKGIALSLSKGFTLIELLIVITILGILAAVVLTAINPVSKINLAKDAVVKSDMGQLANAVTVYYTGANAATYPLSLGVLVSNELKSLPKQQVGVLAYCTDSTGLKAAGLDYCYNGAVTTAVLWAVLPSDVTKSYCWDSTTGAFKTTGIPGSTATACP